MAKTDKTQDTDDTTSRTSPEKRLLGWLLFPVSLFPLVALLTYDWRAVASLQSPANPSSNWLGPIGDAFAHCAYSLFGIAAWIIPVICILYGMRIVTGRPFRPGLRALWTGCLLVSSACLLHILEPHAPGISVVREKFNYMNEGGTVGFVLAGKVLVPLVSDIGASVIVILLLAVSLVASVGPRNIAAFFTAVARWALSAEPEFDPHGAEPGTPEYDEAQAQFELAKAAREEAKRQAAEAKRLAAEAKAREREEKAAAREAARARAEEDRLAREAAKEAARSEANPRPRPAAAKPAAAAPQPPQEKAPEDKGPYILPSASLLAPLRKSEADHSDVGSTGQRLIDTLKIFGVDATLQDAIQGPVVTKYKILLSPGTRYSAVTNLSKNIMGSMHAKSLRIEAPIPGEEAVGIEVPNRKPAGISFREIFESDAWRNSKAELPLLFGKDAAGRELVADLASMPHMLVAGATGQGKSVCLNSLINGLLMTRTPEQLKLIMVDPKSVEFTVYSSIPHLLVPVITENKKVMYSLRWAVVEMEKRLKLFARARVRNIYDFNHRKTFTQTDMFDESAAEKSDIPRSVPYIVIIIDEVADLMQQCGKEVSPDIQRLAQKSRAAGIHLILATQRPDANIITGAIKANIPGRVAFKTASGIDSRTILDSPGAENLIGRGDMLFKGKDGNLIRAQGAWISDEEIANVTKFIEEHSNVEFDNTFATKLGRVKEAKNDDPFADNEDDPDNQQQPEQTKSEQREQVKAAANADDFMKAVECLINTNRASTSHFQRQMGWGYNHAAKILDMLTARGIVSPQQGMGPRTIMLDQEQLKAILNGDKTAGEGGAEEDGGGDPADPGEPDGSGNEEFSLEDDTITEEQT